MNRLDFERKSSTRDSASATFLRRLSISPDNHCPAALACSCRAALLEFQIAVGDRVGDAGREFGIARLELDDDDARFVDRVGGEPVEIGIQHPLFRCHREWIAADSEQRQQRADRRDPAQDRIEFRQFGELVLLDDLACQIAGQQQLDLTGDGLRVERIALVTAFAVRAQENILAAVDQNSRLGFVSWRDQIDGDDRKREGQQRRHDDPALPPRQRLAQHAQFEITCHRRRNGWIGCRREL